MKKKYHRMYSIFISLVLLSVCSCPQIVAADLFDDSSTNEIEFIGEEEDGDGFFVDDLEENYENDYEEDSRDFFDDEEDGLDNREENIEEWEDYQEDRDVSYDKIKVGNGFDGVDCRNWVQKMSVNKEICRSGCRIVSLARILYLAGFTEVGDPDKYFAWGKQNGSFTQTGAESTPFASSLVKFVNSHNGSVNIVDEFDIDGFASVSKKLIMRYINEGYYVMIWGKDHQTMFSNEESIRRKTPVICDTYSLAGSYSYGKYKNYIKLSKYGYENESKYYSHITVFDIKKNGQDDEVYEAYDSLEDQGFFAGYVDGVASDLYGDNGITLDQSGDDSLLAGREGGEANFAFSGEYILSNGIFVENNIQNTMQDTIEDVIQNNIEDNIEDNIQEAIQNTMHNNQGRNIVYDDVGKFLFFILIVCSICCMLVIFLLLNKRRKNEEVEGKDNY